LENKHPKTLPTAYLDILTSLTSFTSQAKEKHIRGSIILSKGSSKHYVSNNPHAQLKMINYKLYDMIQRLVF